MATDNWHPILALTREAAERWQLTPDGRLQSDPTPGVVEVRVSPPQLDRALSLVQAVVDGSLSHGLQIGPVHRARRRRAGVGIGRADELVPVQIVEIRRLLPFSDVDIDAWRRATPAWLIREEELRHRGWVPRPSGRLRFRLPRRHDRPPRGEPGWRFSFSDQVGRPLEHQVHDIVQALVDRAAN